MIQLLAGKFRKPIAATLLLFFYSSAITPLYAAKLESLRGQDHIYPLFSSPLVKEEPVKMMAATIKKVENKKPFTVKVKSTHSRSISGPGQPEMASFKSIGADNMVNLFSGDFNYNIPLMDVGGYPINIFYEAGVGMEQEASWVGLGWNINPGNINRNVRGVPDDFSIKDSIVQKQIMKPNITWGVSLAGDLEGIGIKGLISVGASLGVSFNNYLGPAIDMGVKGGLSFKIAGKAKAEKSSDSSALSLKVSLGANVGSRSGVSFSPSVSLSSSSFKTNTTSSFGLSANTSYNSRYGIKALNIAEQVSFNQKEEKKEKSSVKDYGANRSLMASTSISFAKPSYLPSIRMAVTNEAYSGHFQLGGAIFGVYGSIEAEVYKQSASVESEQVIQSRPAVGYLNYQQAVNNPNAIMDFTRFNDKEVTPSTPIISAPQYTYDVFSIQGEGTGGSIRAYRNDLGSVRDNYTGSKDKSLSVGVDIGIPGHYGANFNTIKTPTTIGEWQNGNKLKSAIPFKSSAGLQEQVYFRNPGETSVVNAAQFAGIGGLDLVRFKLAGSGYSPTIEPKLDRFSKNASFLGTTNITVPASSRAKRTQVISFLSSSEAAVVGLDKMIKSYKRFSSVLDNNNNLAYDSLKRDTGYRKPHHISQINVTESNGKRYIYGIPVYNIIQKDFTFSVDKLEGATGDEQDKVEITPAQLTTNSPLVEKKSSRDGYVQITETPAYAHSFLLSGLLSSDYVDVTDNGITEDDLGDAIKFNYTRILNGTNWAVHKWRTPLTAGNRANFNPGNRTEVKDDKGIVSYGERESWYAHSIESKNMIALFTLEDRNDGKGTRYEYGQIDANDSSFKRLKRIDLYSKADLKKNGLSKAKPIKSVHFEYSYSLCQSTPDNPAGGKLTLDDIYFTFNGQNRVSKNKYVFSYLNSGAGTTGDASGNPGYASGSSDRWGTYKPRGENPQNMKNGDFPYSLQDKGQKGVIDRNAAAWSLKKILLPSGGQIEVNYESDDYAFVQNRRAASMMQIAGFGNNATDYSNNLYESTFLSGKDNDYVFVQVPVACSTKQEVFNRYLQGNDQLAFRLVVNMPKGEEQLTSFGSVENYGVLAGSPGIIWVQLKKVNGLSPLSITALEYLREQLPGQAYPGYDVSEGSSLQQIGDMLVGMLKALKGAFADPVDYLKSGGNAQKAVVNRSFVRLNNPDGVKYGGGHRVKSVLLKDNWQAMTQQYTSTYGQEYDYTTTEVFNGTARTISSGVASYEPSIGGEENPFQSIVQIRDKLPLGPASYGAVEMPVLDAFFPASSVGYSKVTVRSIKKVPADPTLKSRSGIGKQVTEFYTAKDFPVYYSHTSLEPAAEKNAHEGSSMAFFYKYALDCRALTQGFMVETNDMHGKLKSQASYAENDEKTPVNYTQNFYRNTGSKGLDEKFDFVYAATSGTITAGNMGIDVELMTDTREFSVKSSSKEIQGQVDLFPVIFPFWLPFIWPVIGTSESTYRAVTTTKVITYHGVLDSVSVIDKGSQVSTKNLVFDAETGEVVVNRTKNEFNLPVYSTTYPAWWAYSGMGLAYKNIDAVFSNVNFDDGKIITPGFDQAIFESGDELYIIDQGAGKSGCNPASGTTIKLWAFDKNKNMTSLTVPVKDIVFLDKNGQVFTKNGVKFRIIRSGKRNLLDASVSGVTTMSTPVANSGGIFKLKIDNSSQVINAGAVEYKEKWQTDNDVIKKYGILTNLTTCVSSEVLDCNGYLEKSINPYCKGIIGLFKGYKNMIFYDNRKESDANVLTNLPKNGYLNDYSSYWLFDLNNNLVPDLTNIKWTWSNASTMFNSKGLELENKNALDLYTSAQYGYNKTMPTAIVNNGRYNQMFYEGFEDNNYNESINNIDVNNCKADKHIDFSGLDNSQILDMSSSNINAHTGKYVLAVNSGSTSSKIFRVKDENSNNFSVNLRKDTTQFLNTPGVLIENFQSSPISGAQLLDISHGGFRIFTSIGYNVSNGYYSNYFNFNTTHYFNITSLGVYQIGISTSNDGAVDDQQLATADATVYDQDGNLLFHLNNQNNGGASKTLCLKPGIYTVFTGLASSLYSQNPDIGGAGGSVDYYFTVANLPTTSYKAITKENGCVFTRPIAATDSFLNSSFYLSPGKKMVLSAWLREEGINKMSYDSSKISINLGSQNINLSPSGIIIDGWQRYEGTFTTGLSSSQVVIGFVNNSARRIYVDDIRIHPFNANMKSYVYDPVNLRLNAELDENNYATFYEYDDEGTLIRSKVETKEGIKTIKETRSAQQKTITTLQQ